MVTIRSGIAVAGGSHLIRKLAFHVLPGSFRLPPDAIVGAREGLQEQVEVGTGSHDDAGGNGQRRPMVRQRRQEYEQQPLAEKYAKKGASIDSNITPVLSMILT